MAIKTAGVANITLQFESNSAQGFGKFSEAVADETRLMLDRLAALGIRGVEVVDTDVLVGQSFTVLDGSTNGATAEPETEAAPAEAPKRRGRPPKSATAEVAVEAEVAAPKRRGRPPKNAPAAEDAAPTPAPKRGPKGPKRRA